jgi:hypothetical protein
MKIFPIASPLPGEHLAATAPVIRPETDDARWRLRLHFWAGRALTAEALELEQENRAARLAWRARAATAGIVRGLEVALESPPEPPAALDAAGHFIHVLPGHGFLADGEDIVVPRPLRVALSDIPVHYVRVGGENVETPAEPVPDGATSGTPHEMGELVVTVDRFDAGHVPWAAVLLLCPAEFRSFGGVDPEDPCELDPSRDAFADERRIDACMLRLCQLPAHLEALPLLADRDDPRWRNRLAHAIFDEEARASARHQLRFLQTQPAGRRWDTVLRPADLLPWEWLGVPLALLGAERNVEAEARRFFLDRAAVVRQGGGARPRSRPALRVATGETADTLNPPGNGTPPNWRARVDQFAEHLSEFRTAGEAEIAALASRFQFVPPAGFLPRGVVNFLTTAQALVLPPPPGQPPDRAGINHFFPAAFAVEAVPVAIEDLDNALAASASLAPFDFTDPDEEDVRVLVPLPQRVFDPQLLVVEREDPIFAETVGRFAATRQGWRQRRDFVRERRDDLQDTTLGPPPDGRVPPIDPGQVEPEPAEILQSLPFDQALLSPFAAGVPVEISAGVEVELELSPDSSLFFRLRLDEDATPARIEARWTIDGAELGFAWTQPLPALPEQLGEDGRPLAFTLWRHLAVPIAQLGITGGRVERFALHIDDGRIALGAAGQVVDNDGLRDDIIWSAEDETTLDFIGDPWTIVSDERLAAPFEQPFEATFPDGRTATERLNEVETALNPPGATARPVPLSIGVNGLEKVLVELEAEASEADDFVDSHFTRAQVNLYRIRKLILGQTAAQKLLVNPAIAAIAEQETATASADQLGAFITAARAKPKVSAASVTAAINEATPRAFGDFAGIFQPIEAFTPINPVVFQPALSPETLTTAFARFDTASKVATIDLKTAALKDVFGQRPESGPTLPPRGLSIGQRFAEPPATQNLSYARADLTQLLKQLTALRLPLVGETVRALNGTDVLLLALQGRVVPPPPASPPPAVPVTSESIRQAAVTALLTFTAPTTDVDEAEVTLAALDFTEVKSAILRTIERVVQQRRGIVQTGIETLKLLSEQRDAATGRVVAIEGKLAEARHDVSVARALRQEEQQRITETNDRRDALIRDEVKFLAFVRPRAVDVVRRRQPYWRLEPFGVPAPVPACLKRHDEPPDPLNAYIQLFRHAPARWFTGMKPLIKRLDTPDKLVALLDSTRISALSMNTLNLANAVRTSSAAVQFTVAGAHQVLSTLRQKSTVLDIGDKFGRRWKDFERDANEHAAVGDLIDGKHGSREVSVAAASELEQIGQVATCLHAEFAAVPASTRLAWIERFSQFDRPALLRDLTVLPQYARLDRPARRRLQEFVDWLFGRIDATERDATNLVNDLVRLCLLLASHAPVNRIIAGHVPAPTPVRPGIQIPIRPLNPELVRVGMEFHVWQASKIVASGKVEDLVAGAVSARVSQVDKATTTLDPSMRVQFLPAALGFKR